MNVYNQTLRRPRLSEDDSEIIVSPVANKIHRWEQVGRKSVESTFPDTARRMDRAPPSTKAHAAAKYDGIPTADWLPTKASAKNVVKAKGTGVDDDFRYELVSGSRGSKDNTTFTRSFSNSTTSYALKSSLSESTLSCPPSILKDESLDESRDFDWMRSQAQRIQKLNAIKVPEEIVEKYEKSHIVRKKSIDKEEKPKKKNLFGRIRKLVGAGKAKTYKNPALVQKETNVTQPGTETRIRHKLVNDDKNVPSTIRSVTTAYKKAMVHQPNTPSIPGTQSTTKQSLNNELQAIFEKRRMVVSMTDSNDDTPTSETRDRTNEPSLPAKTHLQSIIPPQSPLQQRYVPEEFPTPTSDSVPTKQEDISEENAPKATIQDDWEDTAVKLTTKEEIPEEGADDDYTSVEDETIDDTTTDEKGSIASSTTGGNPLTSWLTRKVDALANIGYDQSCFGSFLDWNGEEPQMAMLEAVAKLADEDSTRLAKNGVVQPAWRKVPKMKLTKRVLTKEEVKARIKEEKRRRRLMENRDPEDAPDNDDGDDDNDSIICQSRSDASLSIKEVKSLTLDRDVTPPVTVAPPATVTVAPKSTSRQCPPGLPPAKQRSNEKKDPPALKASAAANGGIGLRSH